MSKTNNDASDAVYRYNAKGQRVSKQVKQANGRYKTLHFHYDHNNQLIAETDEHGKPVKDYLYTGGTRVAMVDYEASQGGVHIVYIHNDHLGTPKLMTDANQAVTWRSEVLPFGEQLASISDMMQKHQFPGQYSDAESGFNYNYFRDYDPSIGRYVQSDPIGLLGGVNTFGYGYSNPCGSVKRVGLLYPYPNVFTPPNNPIGSLCTYRPILGS